MTEGKKITLRDVRELLAAIVTIDQTADELAAVQDITHGMTAEEIVERDIRRGLTREQMLREHQAAVEKLKRKAKIQLGCKRMHEDIVAILRENGVDRLTDLPAGKLFVRGFPERVTKLAEECRKWRSLQ